MSGDGRSIEPPPPSPPLAGGKELVMRLHGVTNRFEVFDNRYIRLKALCHRGRERGHDLRLGS